MVSQITKGIRVSVRTKFISSSYQYQRFYYNFRYDIEIENTSLDLVHLIAREWHILDTLHPSKVVKGEGVLGQQPLLKPGEKYKYSSYCVLNSTIGAMYGHYEMYSYASNKFFNVAIPRFSLMLPSKMN